MGILRQNIRSDIKIAVLDVEKQEIAKGFGGKGRILQQEIQLVEATGWVLRIPKHPTKKNKKQAKWPQEGAK